jgi:hypothetical protein
MVLLEFVKGGARARGGGDAGETGGLKGWKRGKTGMVCVLQICAFWTVRSDGYRIALGSRGVLFSFLESRVSF